MQAFTTSLVRLHIYIYIHIYICVCLFLIYTFRTAGYKIYCTHSAQYNHLYFYSCYYNCWVLELEFATFLVGLYVYIYIYTYIHTYIYRVSQEECARHREGVLYVKVYRYNPKHLCLKLNGYGDNGQWNLKLWQLLHTYWLPNTY